MKSLVSIIVPTHNNEATIIRTLNSLVEQTLSAIEIIVVDDASTDETLSLCRDAQRFDSRIAVTPLSENQTALQARRIGIEQATGTYVMFCDGDDEFTPQAAEEASSFAVGGGYDVVHFRSAIVSATGTKHGAWERALDPFGAEMYGTDILLSSPFGQPGTKINGCIWNKLYERRLVEVAWKSIDPQLRLPRAQDVYQTFLILANATRYGGLYSPLYTYNFGAGKSGNISTRESFQHFLASSRTYQAVKEYVAADHWEALDGFDPDEMLNRLRDQFIDNQLGYFFKLPRPAGVALGDLFQEWGPDPVLRRLADRHAAKVRLIVEAFSKLETPDLPSTRINHSDRQNQHIALLGNISGSGGVQKVIAVQAELLLRAGYSVTVLSFDHEPQDVVYEFPPGVNHRLIGPRNDVGIAVSKLIRFIRESQVSAVLNHDNYSALFPWLAGITRTLGLPSVLFFHSFALRAFHDFREVFAYLPEITCNYDATVTLSEADRMWWEASGTPNVISLPNFVSASPVDGVSEVIAKDSNCEVQTAASPIQPNVDLLWVGRLQDDTKNVSGVLEVFAQIAAARPQTTLAIVGGEQRPGELARLEQAAQRLGVREQVSFAGQVQDVGGWYRSSKVFLSTGSIEGFNLALVEAQTFGLPVAMYDLPYLEPVIGNPGILAVEWGAAEHLAEVALGLLNDPEKAEQVGAAGQGFAQKFSLHAYDNRLQSILRGILNPPALEEQPSNNTAKGPATAIVPVSIVRELYRLYERMHRRTASELHTTKQENASLRKNLSQLKHSITESKAQHQRLEKAIAQIETKKPKGTSKKVEQQLAPEPEAGGVWPLWARQGIQPLETPMSAVFDDLEATDPVALPAAWALDSGLLDPPTSRHFNGDRIVTRYEFIAMLHRLAGSPNPSSTPAAYRDLEADDPVTAWAIRRAILKPASSKDAPDALPSWNPNGVLLRRSAAMMLFRAAGAPQYRPPHLSPYGDLTVSKKFYKEMCWTAHQGILPGARQEDDSLIFNEKRLVTLSDAVVALFNQMVGPLALPDNG